MDQEEHISAGAGSAEPRADSMHRVARNSVLSLLATALSAAFTLVVVIVLARTLGKESLGRYYSVFVATVIVQLVLEAGLSTVLTRRIAHTPQGLARIVAEARGIFLLVGAASGTVLAGLGMAWSAVSGDPAPVRFGVLAGIACGAMQVEQLAAGVFRGIERFDLEAAAKVLQGLAFALLVILCRPSGASGVEVALGLLMASHVLSATFSWGLMRRQAPKLGWRLNGAVLADWLGEAVPLGLGDIFRRLTFQIDHLLLALMQPPAVLGLYSVAYRPLGPLSLVPRAIVTATFPYFARIAEHDPAALRRAFTANTRLLWILSLPLATTIAALAEPVVRILAGSAFLEAVLPMRVLAFVLVLSFPSTQFRFALAACGRQKLFTWLVLAGLIFETAVEVVLIRRFGYMGACSGFLIGEIGFTFVGLVVCERLGLGAIPWRALLCATPAAGVMGAGLLWAQPLPPAVQFILAGVFTVVYFGFCVLCGAVRRSEIELLVAAVARPLGRRMRRHFAPPAAGLPASTEVDAAATVREG